jgi:CheY-like chemotaxis protein
LSTRVHRIAVVEDEEMIRETIVEFLGDQGYEAFGAVHGRDALDKLTNGERRPCLILLDLMMPVMDGWAFRAQQLQTPGLTDIPVVVFSAYPDANKTASELGAVDYLPKPVNLTRLLDVIERHCSED